MIVSTDYSYLRLAASPSDYMKEQHPDKRSWWVDPQGKIYDVGHDHNKFLEEHEEIFGDWADIDKALTLNWIRVAFWGTEYVVHCHMITKAQIAACQEIYKSLGGNYKVYISTLNKNGYISLHDFIWADSASDLIRNLFRDPTGIRASRRVGSEDRAWLISPDNEVIACGEDHEEFVVENQDLFRSIGADGLTLEELVIDGWGKVGLVGPLLYLECARLTDFFFKKLQEFAKKLEQVNRVMLRKRVIDRQEFLFLDGPADLRWIPPVSSRSRLAVSEDRAWLVSPGGEVINCETNHANFLHRNQDLMRSMGAGGKNLEKLVEEGWGKIGLFGSLLYIECKRLNDLFFKVLQDLTKGSEKVGRLMVNEEKLIDRREFLQMDSPIEVRLWPSVESGRRKVSSLPKSRNFLMGVSLDSLSWPLRQAFDLLNLSEKKDRLSANQVASVFQANDEFLQDNLGRTSTELIQDLNGFFQYGPVKE